MSWAWIKTATRYLPIRWLRRLIVRMNIRRKYGQSVIISPTADVSIHSKFEGMNQIHPRACFDGDLGFGSYVGPESVISGKIGRFTSIAPHVRCNAGRHPYTYPYVTTAPCFFSLNPNHSQNGSTFATSQEYNELAYADKGKKYVISVGNDCWIGEGAFIVGGTEIADGAVVLAHAVVTKNVPPYAIVGGVPAKIIGYRYSDDDINFLLRIKWWDNSLKWFETYWHLLNDFDKLKQYYESKNAD